MVSRSVMLRSCNTLGVFISFEFHLVKCTFDGTILWQKRHRIMENLKVVKSHEIRNIDATTKFVCCHFKTFCRFCHNFVTFIKNHCNSYLRRFFLVIFLSKFFPLLFLLPLSNIFLEASIFPSPFPNQLLLLRLSLCYFHIPE